MAIKMIVFDVDGTLTDGGIYIGNDGEVMKKFNVKDGYAIHSIMPKYGMLPVIITGRTSDITYNRCKELGIDHIYQGVKDKKKKLQEIARECRIEMSEIGYIGDDVNDIECMKIVGFPACPANAVDEVKSVCKYICKKNGGDAAVREYVEMLINA